MNCRGSSNGVKEDKMQQRWICIWFQHLATDWVALRRKEWKELPFVLAVPEHGRMVVRAANAVAQTQGIDTGMTVADARALVPALEVLDKAPGLEERLLKALGEWCIRYTPVVVTDPPDGLLLDATGCAHLWGGEQPYLKEIVTQLSSLGYDARGAIADTIGTAWAIARFGQVTPIIASGEQAAALRLLPPAALRLEPAILERLQKLGLATVGSLAGMQRSALRRRFGEALLLRLDQALGTEMEIVQPIQTVAPYQERLPCLEPIVTAAGIEMALQRLLEQLCKRLQQEGKGLRGAVLKGFRTDGKIIQAAIGTSRASHHIEHLLRLFELQIPALEPAAGIELFLLEASGVEDTAPGQESLWGGPGGLEDVQVAELLDRLAGKIGTANIHRYLPAEHHWPELSVKLAASLQEMPAAGWQHQRPIHLLAQPEMVEVTAPIPDYPPMLFRYKGQLHKIVKADCLERVGREWWLETGEHRDYYRVEDEKGQRYWLFRSGHYTPDKPHSWFIHGFFA